MAPVVAAPSVLRHSTLVPLLPLLLKFFTILTPLAGRVRTASALATVSSPPATEILRTYSLSDSRRGTYGRCWEVTPPPPRNDEGEEDEVEAWYPTSRRSFVFDTPGGASAVVTVRQTSFGCGRLGSTVWRSAIALSCHLLSAPSTSTDPSTSSSSAAYGRHVLELGAGCGLPSAVCRDVGEARRVLSTDFWEDHDGGGGYGGGGSSSNDGKGKRLVPGRLFGINLAHNVVGDGGGFGGDDEARARVRWLDWHNDPRGRIEAIVNEGGDEWPDYIIGSDLVYYPEDLDALLETLRATLLGGGGPVAGRRREALLFCPLPPSTKREALPEFQERLKRGELGEGLKVEMDEVELAKNFDDEPDRFLRVVVTGGIA